MTTKRMTKIRVSGNEALVALPPEVLAECGLKDGHHVRVIVEAGAILLWPVHKEGAGDNLKGLVAQINMQALALFEGDETAKSRWMRSPIRALGWKSPNEMLQSAKDIETLRLVIGRLDSGSFP